MVASLYRIGKYGPSRRISFQLRRDKKQFSWLVITPLIFMPIHT